MEAPKIDGLILPACVLVGFVGWGVIEFAFWVFSHITVSWA